MSFIVLLVLPSRLTLFDVLYLLICPIPITVYRVDGLGTMILKKIAIVLVIHQRILKGRSAEVPRTDPDITNVVLCAICAVDFREYGGRIWAVYGLGTE